MKFSVETKRFREVVIEAAKFISTRTTDDKFYCLRVDVYTNYLKVCCCRPGEMVYYKCVDGVALMDGSTGFFLVDCRKLAATLMPINPVGLLIMNSNDRGLKISHERATFEMTSPKNVPQDYNPLDSFVVGDRDLGYVLSTPWLRTALYSSAECADQRNQLAAIRGVNIQYDQNKQEFRLFGTDTCRVGMSIASVRPNPAMEKPVGLHKAIYVSAAGTIADCLEPEKETTVAFGSSGVMFTQGLMQIFATGIPTFNQDLLAMFSRPVVDQLRNVTVPSAELAGLIRKGLTVAGSQVVSICVRHGEIGISAIQKEAGAEMTSKINVPYLAEPRPDVIFNGRQLLRICEFANDRDIVWHGTKPGDAQIFSVNGTELRYAVMPLEPAAK